MRKETKKRGKRWKTKIMLIFEVGVEGNKENTDFVRRETIRMLILLGGKKREC
jgi:hypothetical protein